MCRPHWHDNWPTSEIISAINIIWWSVIHSVVKIIISTINFIIYKHNSFAKCSTKCKTNFFFVFLWVKIFRNSVFTVFMSGRTEMEIFGNDDADYRVWWWVILFVTFRNAPTDIDNEVMEKTKNGCWECFPVLWSLSFLWLVHCLLCN